MYLFVTGLQSVIFAAVAAGLIFGLAGPGCVAAQAVGKGVGTCGTYGCMSGFSWH
jgi:hypothetical protein